MHKAEEAKDHIAEEFKVQHNSNYVTHLYATYLLVRIFQARFRLHLTRGHQMHLTCILRLQLTISIRRLVSPTSGNSDQKSWAIWRSREITVVQILLQ
jgi:hypothetical protein